MVFAAGKVFADRKQARNIIRVVLGQRNQTIENFDDEFCGSISAAAEFYHVLWKEEEPPLLEQVHAEVAISDAPLCFYIVEQQKNPIDDIVQHIIGDARTPDEQGFFDELRRIQGVFVAAKAATTQ
jgi:hypothetical protein